MMGFQYTKGLISSTVVGNVSRKALINIHLLQGINFVLENKTMKRLCP